MLALLIPGLKMGGGGVNNTANPSAAVIRTVVPAPTTTSGGNSTPTAAIILFVVPSPTVTCGGSVTPSASVISSVVPSPVVTCGVSFTIPAASVFSLYVPNPTVRLTTLQYRLLATVLGERDTFPIVIGSRDVWDIVEGDSVSVPTKNLEMYRGEDRSLEYSIAEDLSSISLACTITDSHNNVLASFTSAGGSIVKSTNGTTSTGYVQIDSDSSDLSPGVYTWSIFSNTSNDHAEYCNGKLTILAPRAIV